MSEDSREKENEVAESNQPADATVNNENESTDLNVKPEEVVKNTAETVSNSTEKKENELMKDDKMDIDESTKKLTKEKGSRKSSISSDIQIKSNLDNELSQIVKRVSQPSAVVETILPDSPPAESLMTDSEDPLTTEKLLSVLEDSIEKETSANVTEVVEPSRKNSSEAIASTQKHSTVAAAPVLKTLKVVTSSTSKTSTKGMASLKNSKEGVPSTPKVAKNLVTSTPKVMKPMVTSSATKLTKEDVVPPGPKRFKDMAASTSNSLATLTSNSAKEKSTPTPTSSTAKDIVAAGTHSEPGRPVKKYVYRLKSKTGKVLKYTSSVPIVLKKPIITLTKMEEEIKDEISEKGAENETDEVDSDNSTKENNIKENDASRDSGARLAKKRGRPPLSQKTPVITLDDQYSSDTTDGKDNFRNNSAPSFGMQTRKRQLKFLPDGRLVTPGKKYKASSDEKCTEDSVTSDSETESDEDSLSDRKAKKSVNVATKKFTPLERRIADKRGKFRKVFDFDSYYREKSGLSPSSETPSPSDKVLSAPNKIVEIQKSTSVSTASCNSSSSTPKISTPSLSSSVKTAVDPAQLLSSLIGVPISPSQLNVVKFKPKVIQDRSAVTSKKVTYVEDVSRKSGSPGELLKNTPFKVVSKPTLQKILPRPLLVPDKTPISAKKSVETKSVTSPMAFSSMPPKLNSVASTPVISNVNALNEISKFNNFADTRIVKTKEGPKKFSLQKENQKINEASEANKTVYDLVQFVFDQMPSWNLHIIPDTNSFCIAQVSRGRMGIPILKKSIELNAEFSAKVYVHQLHCKKYDGVYDTENKILSLIREIDALAA